MAPFRATRRQPLQPAEAAFNADLSRCRISVENAFGSVANLWRYTQFDAQLQALSQPVAACYMVSVLLTNIYICMKGSPSPFGLRPPSVEEYLDPGKWPL